MKKNIFIADKFLPEHIEKFTEKIGKEYSVSLFNEKLSLKDQVSTANVIVAYGRDLDKDILSAANDLEMVVQLGTAKGRIDTDYLNFKKIEFRRTASPALVSVAEHAFSFMLAFIKETFYSDSGVRANLNPENYEEAHTDQLNFAYNWLNLQHFDCMYRKTLGIVGFGVVGQRLARMGNAFDMDVIYFDLNRLAEKQEKQLNVRYGSFDEVLQQSDFISCHLKLNDSTRGLFNKEAFSKMKRTAFFVNTSRGPIVCEADMIDALQNGQIAGAGLDVFEVEPLPASSALKKMSNVILSAHSGGIPLYRSLFTELIDGAEMIKEKKV